ncbi:MAG: PEP-CTERM sorting domain-containing protein [Phycisphaerae bacterium]|nr:PEP-CTERM sorting domain-containing protein [Phycisphaerae bacterium]
MKQKLVLVIGLALVPALAFGAPGDILYSSDLDTGAGFTVYADADSLYQFGYDYSAMGIPAAPNGGGTTTGLYTAVNLTGAAAAGLHAVTDLSATGQYKVEFDMWANVPHTNGTTEFIGGGVGHLAGAATLDGAELIITGEGGSSYDYRLYKNTGLQYPASGQYAAPGGSNNNSDPYYAGFGGGVAPLYQQSTYGAPATPLAAGTIGFDWHTMTIEVFPDVLGSGVTSDLGVAYFYLDDLLIGHIDNSNGGTVVNMEGGIDLAYVDLYASAADPSALAFGVFDNFVVTEIPEPASLLLIALGALVLRRR